MPTVPYPIQPSGETVSGTPVGNYLAIRTEKYGIGGKRKRYIIDHVPTGYKMFQYDKLGTARKVAKALHVGFGDVLGFTDPAGANRLHEIDPTLLDWARVANDYPDRVAWEAKLAQKQAAEAAEEAAQREWEGLTFYWGPGSLSYGLQGKILNVHSIDPATPGPLGPEVVVADVKLSPTRTALGRHVYTQEIVKGKAPRNLPWAEMRRNKEWGARINNMVYRLASVGSKWLLWTKEGSIPESRPREYGSREEAERAAEEHARSRKKNPGRSAEPDLVRALKF